MKTTLFKNAKVWTGTNSTQLIDSFVVNGEKFLEVNNNLASDKIDEVIDLQGKFVSSSFGDGHCHPLFGGRQFFGPNITDMQSIDDILNEVKNYSLKNPDLPWIIGGTYDPALRVDGNFDATWLDKACNDRPVVLNAMDYHTIWVNSAALRIANINQISGNPKIGTIVRRDDGSAMGTMREWDAVNLIMNHAPKPEISREIAALKYASERYAKSGITWWQDAWVDPGMAESYLAAMEAGVLKQGVNLAFRADPRSWQSDLNYFVEMRNKIASSNYSNKLTALTIKYFADGVIEGGTAALIDPYSNDPCYHGMPVWEWEELTRAVEEFDRAGFQTHIHAIGDAGVRAALNAIENAITKNQKWDRRPTIAHVQLVHPEDFPRFKKLGVLTSFAPLWCKQDPMQLVSSAPRIGPERTATQYQINSLLKEGVSVGFGSDWPVTSEVVLEGLPVAVHREMPDKTPPGGWIPNEKISMNQAFAAYTSAVSYQGFQENNWGKIAPGLNANFVVLSQNPFEIDPHEVSKIKIEATYLDGEIIYQG